MNSNYNKKICYKKIITKNNFFGVNFFHTSGVIYSNNNPVNVTNLINEQIASDNGVVNDLAVVPFGANPPINEVLPIGDISGLYESFPWLFDAEGKAIDYNKSLKLFDGIKLISRYLELKFNVDPSLLSDAKLSELIKLFQEEKDIRVIDLFNYIQNKYLNDKNFSKSFNLNPESSSVSDNPVLSNSNFENSKPFGEMGEVTLNNAAVYLKDLKWNILLNNTQATVNALPLAGSLLSYGLVMRGYMKIIHNRPYPIYANATQKIELEVIRNKQLATFAIIGAPIVICLLKTISIPLKDVISVNLPVVNSTESNLLNESQNSENINSSSSLLLLLNNFNKKIPNWLKLLFKLILLSILVLKLVGINFILDILNNSFYLKLYMYLSLSLGILYQLLNIYLIYKFSKPETKISEFYPEFIIKWLKGFETLCQSKEITKYLKDMFYREILVYIVIIIMITVLI